MKNVEAWSARDIVEALAEGNRPFIPGGYHTKEDRISLRNAATELAGYSIRCYYSGEAQHRYYFVRDEEK